MGIVHGDLHVGNLMIGMDSSRNPSIDSLSTDQIYEQFGAPKPELFPGGGGGSQPTHMYPFIWLGKGAKDWTTKETRLVIADLGTSFLPSKHIRTWSGTPLGVRPPELHFLSAGTPLGLPSDIWTLGCTLFHILSSCSLMGSYFWRPSNMIDVAMHMLGPLPQAWWDRWGVLPSGDEQEDELAQERRAGWLDNGVPLPHKPGYQLTLDERFESCVQENRRLEWFVEGLSDVEKAAEQMSDDERDALLEMIRAVLRFNPSERLTASEILDTRWMREYGLPAAEKTWGRPIWP
ncbi:kinase-like domain-containing protein [Microdochium trichocladiopsis]|uniref:Kinase-like domain-containing protein n=1 Tax=Microdochium trichocladiopsis TaxID=1682393 RepID=A0A9P8XSS8_9PEZI|nr:kinase-like domain-containing protein [Microdochium trichocladiopsis]KAH7014591.1 kinase-like domain-containing protein [Microdochium trichocladiopsis]